MKSFETNRTNKSFNRRYALLGAISCGCLTASFAISNGHFDYLSKLTTFVLIVTFYVLTLIIIYWRVKTSDQNEIKESSAKSFFNAQIEAKLAALEEANQFFGASLKTADMFRLIANRINELIAYQACAFYIADEKKEKLKAVFATDALKNIVGTEVEAHFGLAGKVFQSRQTQIEKTRRSKTNYPAGDHFENSPTAICAALLNGTEAFGVLVLYGEFENSFDSRSLSLIEAISIRIAPLFLSSRAFEDSLTNALTDSLTGLPNERAFFLVLENQIAESQRFRDDRPLTILSIDIKNFGELNQRIGHATGDQLLLFAADKIKNQLRQMDFLARSSGDEFLAVLPTASKSITLEIIERIEKFFVSNPFETSVDERVHLQLSFGAASFGTDGETVSELLKIALLRKQRSKTPAKDHKVLFFPKEYVN